MGPSGESEQAMTDREQAVIDAARALLSRETGLDDYLIGHRRDDADALRAALTALDSEPNRPGCDPECVHCATWRSEPTYRERVARLYRGEEPK